MTWSKELGCPVDGEESEKKTVNLMGVVGMLVTHSQSVINVRKNTLPAQKKYF